jgi:hypothetical protein
MQKIASLLVLALIALIGLAGIALLKLSGQTDGLFTDIPEHSTQNQD